MIQGLIARLFTSILQHFFFQGLIGEMVNEADDWTVGAKRMLAWIRNRNKALFVSEISILDLDTFKN